MRAYFEYFFVRFIIFLVRILPKGAVYAVFSGLSSLLFSILKRRRDLAIKNIKMALNLDDSDSAKMAKSCFLGLGRTAAESLMIFADKFDFKKMIVNAGDLEAFLDGLGRPAVIITAHFGNWEALSHYAAISGHPHLVIAREGNNQLIERRLTRPSREKYGNTLVYKHEAMAKMVRTIKEGGAVGLLPDLNAAGAGAVAARFFGRLCWSTKTLASIVLKYRPNTAIIVLKRRPDGCYEAVIRRLDFGAILAASDSAKIKELAITQAMNDELEAVIKSAPEQWFWVHNRWREYDDKPLCGEGEAGAAGGVQNGGAGGVHLADGEDEAGGEAGAAAQNSAADEAAPSPAKESGADNA